ncbi:MAG: hypothetical protein AABW87_02990 [Nanoarchaeota archaeon]
MKIVKILLLIALTILGTLSVSALDYGYSRFDTFGRRGTLDFGRGAFNANSMLSSLDSNSLNADFLRNDFARTFSSSNSLNSAQLQSFLRDFSNSGSNSFRDGFNLNVGDCSDPKAATFRDKVRVTAKDDFGSSNFLNSGNKVKRTYTITRRTCDGTVPRGNIFRDTNFGNSFDNRVTDANALASLTSRASSEDISDSKIGRTLNFDQNSLTQNQETRSFESFGKGSRLILNKYLN